MSRCSNSSRPKDEPRVALAPRGKSRRLPQTVDAGDRRGGRCIEGQRSRPPAEGRLLYFLLSVRLLSIGVQRRWRRGVLPPGPVPPSICQCDYVRSSPVEVSRRWTVSNPRLDEFSRISLVAGERDVELAQISDTAVNAPGGLSQRQGTQPKLRSQGQVVVGFCWFSRVFYQGLEHLGTPHRRHNTCRA